MLATERYALAAWGGSVDSPPKRRKLKATTKAEITRRVPQVGCTRCWAVVLEDRHQPSQSFLTMIKHGLSSSQICLNSSNGMKPTAS